MSLIFASFAYFWLATAYAGKYKKNYDGKKTKLLLGWYGCGYRLCVTNENPKTGPFLTSSATETAVASTAADFDICAQPHIGLRGRIVDAVVTVADKSTYAFAGPYYWKLGQSVIEHGYPRLIADDWKGLPTDGLDTAVTWQNVTYFFKDGVYWRFANRQPLDIHPAPMSVEFPGIPKAVDAAVVWSGNNQLYFFSGDQYWQFKFDDQKHTAAIPANYPLLTQKYWPGVRLPVDVATQWSNNRTYLFSGDDEYTRYNDQLDRVDDGYPVSIRKEWFGCGSASAASTTAPVQHAECNVARGFNIVPGNDHGYVNNVSSAEDCCEICRAVARTGCKAFVYDDGSNADKKCWLKSVVEPLLKNRENINAVVGFV